LTHSFKARLVSSLETYQVKNWFQSLLSNSTFAQWKPGFKVCVQAQLVPLHKGEMTWFSAGVRIGVGVGLGVCLGLGLGVGILVNGYKVSRDRLTNMKQALRYR
jgi:hypothetical protein